MIVVDASVVVDFVLGPGSEAADAFAGGLEQGEVFGAPHLIDAEVGQVIRRMNLRGDISDSDAVDRLATAANLPIRRYPHFNLLGRAFELRANVTIYDGLYLVLAEVLNVSLWTGDSALTRVPGSNALVHLVATSA